MSEGPDNFIPQYLRRMDAKMDRMGDELRDIKVPLTAVEEAVVGVQRRIDRLDMRVEPTH
jgi:hypothetical protein